MTRIAYLGSIGKAPVKHVPGVLKFTKDISLVSEHEMDLLLARQRLEIEKANSAAVGGPFNWQIDKYDKAIGVINNALAAVNNNDPEYIKKLSDHFHATGQPMIGGFFGKIWKGIKKVGGAVVKVATFPLRFIAKGVMEIYLPKAAYGFLYLFAAENILPDKMKAKRKKAEKFKNFVCKKIGMKEKHFMGIVRNSLTKKFGMSPESYLAKSLKAVAVKGIGAIGKAKRKKQVNNRRGSFSKITSEMVKAGSSLKIQNIQLPDGVQSGDGESIEETGSRGQSAGSALVQAGSAAARGDIIGAIIAAVSWIISKLGGKKAGVSFGKEDIPDIAADSGNAFNYGDLKNDYSRLSPFHQEQVKAVTSDLIEQGYDSNQAAGVIRQRLPFLNNNEVNEISNEVATGYEPITDEQGNQLAREIKGGAYPGITSLDDLEASGGGPKGGICKC